ncbi:MAG TPA: hypothetical protein VGW35_04120 [Methylomirabilota bacterium]|nr:hypothetical protein [Methylomirabilota bacterium]
MLNWLRGLFSAPRPAGPPQRMRAFGPSDTPLTRDGVSADQAGWRIECREGRTIRLFEVAPGPGTAPCLLAYRVQLKTADAQGRVYLEMWCRLPGKGEFFSKGFQHAVKGTVDWGAYEVPFYLKAGQHPDLLKLNLVCEGAGTVWVKDVEVLRTPLA